MPPNCYFIVNASVPEIILAGDTLLIPGTESYEGILAKTLTAFDYFLSRDSYDFVVRTNVSSIWDYPKLLAKLSTRPHSGYYGGSIGGGFGHLMYASGSGMVLTPDVCKKLSTVAFNFQWVDDDVAIGIITKMLNVEMINDGDRLDVMFDTTDIPAGWYHYRVRLVPYYTQTRDPEMITKTINCMERVRYLMSSS